MGEYEFDFSYDNGKWEFNYASITSGVLYMWHINSYARRYPESNWGRGALDNFKLEIDVRIYTVPDDPEYECIWYGIAMRLPDVGGEARWISFEYFYYKDYTMPEFPEYWNIMRIITYGTGWTSVRAEANIDLRDTNWHKFKISRIGKTYYFDIDGTQINWTCPTYEEWQYFDPWHDMEGAYDDFKYSWWKEVMEQDQAFIM